MIHNSIAPNQFENLLKTRVARTYLAPHSFMQTRSSWWLGSTMSINDTKASVRLVTAAEELLQASGVEVASERQKTISADLVSFKESVDAKLSTVVQTINSSNTNFDDKLKTTNQHIVALKAEVASLKGEVASLKAELVRQTRMQNLTFAIDHTNLESFNYYEALPNSYGTTSRKSSSTLVSRILLYFRRDQGMYLPAVAMKSVSTSDKVAWGTGNKEFRTMLRTKSSRWSVPSLVLWRTGRGLSSTRSKFTIIPFELYVPSLVVL